MTMPGDVDIPTADQKESTWDQWTNLASRYQQFLYGVAAGSAAVLIAWSVRSRK